MINAPVLAMPDFNKSFTIETDASDKEMWAVLMQDKKPIAFMSKSLGIRNQGPSTYENEFLALLTTVSKWRHCLLGGQFIIKTDQISLKHLLEQRVNHMMQHKGLCKLMGLDYKIEYKKGIENKVADALSRQVTGRKEEKFETLTVTELIPQWVDEIKDSYINDTWIEGLQNKNSGLNSESKFTQSNGLWKYKDKLCIETNGGWRERLIGEVHNSSQGGHSGIQATYKRVKAQFYWPNMRETIHKYVSGCNTCQQTKGENVKLPGLLQPLPVPEEAWVSISMDFISGLPRSEGKEVIMVIVDRLTKYAHLAALQHPFSASDVARVFLETVYKLHGLPQNIISDRDPIFTSKFWKEIMEKMRVKLKMSTAYHPQTDGQIERVNQCIENYLRSMMLNQPKLWTKWLAMAEYWYNTNFHSALNTTPFKALYGYDPPQLPMGTIPRCSVEAVNELMKERHEWLQELKNSLKKAQERMKKFADQKRSERTFAIGDWVYLKLHPYRQVSLKGSGHERSHKLSPKFYGPFEIVDKKGELAYELNLPTDSQVHPVFHVSQLRGKVGEGHEIMPNLPLVGMKNKQKEEPEAIIGRRLTQRGNQGVVQILVRWKGQTDEDASWEDYHQLEKQFPHFILRDKEYFEKGRVSGIEINKLLAVGEEIKNSKLNKQLTVGPSAVTVNCKQTEENKRGDVDIGGQHVNCNGVKEGATQEELTRVLRSTVTDKRRDELDGGEKRGKKGVTQ
ncbi:polyprotein [Rhynchospora pubera]|uniref:Polyprotein n=1 Tax=Rhynchospora pubera TaxID=906938 RepID=A0AAV8GRS1_9POAL|nr:polyprotein [Rhynchospora pubera]